MECEFENKYEKTLVIKYPKRSKQKNKLRRKNENNKIKI